MEDVITVVNRPGAGIGDGASSAQEAPEYPGKPSGTDTQSGGIDGVAVAQRHGSKKSAWITAKSFLISNFLPLGFLVALGFALAWPQPGVKVASWKVGSVRMVQAINNFLVFLVSGLTLKSDDFKQAATHWVGLAYGFVSILFLTACLGFATRALPLTPPAFAVGLTIFCVVPTTLGVGVALTAAAKGNQALALLLTVGTNMLGIVTVPYILKLLLTGSSEVAVDPLDLFVKLLLTVLVPTVIGKVLRSTSRRVRDFVKAHKTALSLFSTSNLVIIVWQTLSGARDVLLDQSVLSITVIIACVILQHLTYLLFNTIAVRLLRQPLREGIAVVIMTSQKSAPVAVTVISYITPSLAMQGLFAIPALMGQLTQIFVGSFMVKFLAKKVKDREEE